MPFSNRNMSFFQLLKEFLPLFVARVLFSEPLPSMGGLSRAGRKKRMRKRGAVGGRLVVRAER